VLTLVETHRPRLYAYVDGFNLYYSALRNTPYKWLDLRALFAMLFPDCRVVAIKYFTAHVSARPDDPDQPVRQQIYLRALKTLPEVEIVLGTFLSHKRRMLLACPDPSGQRFADVIYTEEKGSDVNLATHLLCDALEGAFEIAAVLTNDSDLALPVRIAREKFKRKVVLVGYDRRLQERYGKGVRAINRQLLEASGGAFKALRESHLAKSLFPDELQDSRGRFRKPRGW
jgi:hypothetical protein